MAKMEEKLALIGQEKMEKWRKIMEKKIFSINNGEIPEMEKIMEKTVKIGAIWNGEKIMEKIVKNGENLLVKWRFFYHRYMHTKCLMSLLLVSFQFILSCIFSAMAM